MFSFASPVPFVKIGLLEVGGVTTVWLRLRVAGLLALPALICCEVVMGFFLIGNLFIVIVRAKGHGN